MKAAVLAAPKTLELRELQVPEPGPGQVLVRIRAAALCTMEKRAYLGLQQVPFPWVGGHEIAGEVWEVGPGTPTTFQKGDRVAIGPSSCGQCYHCRRGYQARCLTGFTRTSYAGMPGGWGLAEYRLTSPAALYKVPEFISLDEAALAEPLGCAIHGCRRAGVALGDDVVIIGAGPMGCLNLLVAKRMGARAIVIDLDSEKAAKAHSLGADLVLSGPAEESIARVKEVTDGRGADVVIAAVGGGKVNALASELAGKTGTIVLFAASYPPEPLTIDPNLVHKNEMHLLGVEGKSVEDFQIAVKLVSSRIIDVRPLLDAHVPLAQVETAFAKALAPQAYRVVVNP